MLLRSINENIGEAGANRFSSGAKVFAKIRGYQPWPARIENVLSEMPHKVKYQVYFYGTGDSGIVKAEDISYYVYNKDKFGKPKKRHMIHFSTAILEIEGELSIEEKDIMINLENDRDKGPNLNDMDGLDQTNSTLPGKKRVERKQTSGKRSFKRAYPNQINHRGKKKTSDEILQLDESLVDSNIFENAIKDKGSNLNDIDKVNNTLPGKKRVERKQTSGKKSIKRAYPNQINHRGKKKRLDESLVDSDIFEITLKGKGQNLNDSDGLLDKANTSTAKKRRKRTSRKGSIKNASQNQKKNETISDKLSQPNENIDESSSDDSDVRVEIGEHILANVNNEEILIPLTLNKPQFEQKILTIIWSVKVKIFANYLKQCLESGDLSPTSVNDVMDKWTKKQAKRNVNIDLLKTEEELFQLNMDIKDSLSFSSPNILKTIHLLDELSTLNVTPVMLKKRNEILLTLINIRKYSPPPSSDSEDVPLSSSEPINEQILLMRYKADYIFNKFTSLFDVPPSKTFLQFFRSELKNFKLITRYLSDLEFITLIDDPINIIQNV